MSFFSSARRACALCVQPSQVPYIDRSELRHPFRARCVLVRESLNRPESGLDFFCCRIYIYIFFHTPLLSLAPMRSGCARSIRVSGDDESTRPHFASALRDSARLYILRSSPVRRCARTRYRSAVCIPCSSGNSLCSYTMYVYLLQKN